MSLSSHEELLMLRKRARRRLVGATVMVFVATAVLWNVLGALPDQEMRPEKVEIAGLPASATQVAPLPASAPVAALASQPQETDILAELPPEGSELEAPVVAGKPHVASAAVAAPVVVAPVRVAPSASAPLAAKSAEPVLPKKAEPALPKPPVEKKTNTEKPLAEKSPPPAEKKPAPRDPAAILEGRDLSENAAPAKPEAKGEKFQIQLAALSDPAKVDALKQRLAAAGVSARFSKVQTSKGEVTRVRVGPFGSRAEADSALRRLDKAGVSGIVVTQ